MISTRLCGGVFVAFFLKPCYNTLKGGVKMIDISVFVDGFLKALDRAFANRVWFVGLQGSYARGEATDKSDIDIVVILDKLSPADITVYRTMLDGMPDRAYICGFLSGKDELLRWLPADLFQFYYDTKPIRGSLEELLPLLDKEAVDTAISIGACNIYHGVVHNMLHAQSKDILIGLYKAASFTVRACVFRRIGAYYAASTELMDIATPLEREILTVYRALKNEDVVDFDQASSLLFAWAQNKFIG